ncbi:hypothetical protein SCHPADRAFT_686778 [Schizopora paradoxa]|uniref:Uncharacterized protein n=1 Tax=Schizopora paradoxa TaxID=27342 RepID=A0A0H2RP23_9AGAM|nr:hypothetical protein SCHPADRAFT_686778 [Schizopora paradoxa]
MSSGDTNVRSLTLNIVTTIASRKQIFIILWLIGQHTPGWPFVLSAPAYGSCTSYSDWRTAKAGGPASLQQHNYGSFLKLLKIRSTWQGRPSLLKFVPTGLQAFLASCLSQAGTHSVRRLAFGDSITLASGSTRYFRWFRTSPAGALALALALALASSRSALIARVFPVLVNRIYASAFAG